MVDREWIVIADAHLGAKPRGLERLLGLVESLDPKTQGLWFLGDLFHIWAGPKKFRTPPVDRLVAALWAFREAGGVSRLVVGNRDAFFKEIGPADPPYQGLPFAVIALDFDTLETAAGLVLAHHGDLVNQTDQAYLRWRGWMRGRWLRLPFALMPKPLAQSIMFRLEAKLQQTNLGFKMSFPQAQWQRFVENIAQTTSPKLLLVGHFHPPQPIETQVGQTLGLVVPGWLETCTYLKVKTDLTYETLVAAP